MLTFKEMIYVFAILTICFLSCVFKTKFLIDGMFGNVVGMYILMTFALFACAVLLFVFIRKKCVSYETNPQREAFLTLKKIKNASELIYVAVAIFFAASLFDIFNAGYIGKVYKDITVLFTSYPLWEVLIGCGVLIFGFKSYMRYYKTNKVFSALECENYKKVPESVYQVMNRYPTSEEYEKGTVRTTVPKAAHRASNDEQERFLKENEVPIEDIEQRLAGLNVTGIRNGKPIYSKTDLASTDPGDNSLSVCPFCGSLNTSGSGECSFCGGRLDK